jgi:hypothetical protein
MLARIADDARSHCMPLSVPSSNNGPSLSSLLRQTKPLKADEGASVAQGDTPAVPVRSGPRSNIDSTQRGTAQITAALTVYLSKLGGSDETGPARTTAGKAASTALSNSRSGSPATGRSGAADLLRTLDAYKTPGRLSLTA